MERPLRDVITNMDSGARPKGGAQVSGVPSIGAEHLDGDGGFNLGKIKYIPEEFYGKLRGGKICRNDILIVKDGATTGKTCFVTIDFPFESAAINEHVFRLTPDTTKIDASYLFRFLSSPYGNRQMMMDFRGATVGGISRGIIDKVNIPLFPLPEQKRIAAILDKADALRQKRKQSLKLLDEFLRSVFLEMFGDPVVNPKGWEIEYFGEVCETRLGKMLDAKQQTGKHRRPYLRNTNVQWGFVDVTEVCEMDFDEREREILRLKYGELLICEGGEVGRTAIWRDELHECYFQKAIHRARPNPKIAISEFLQYVLWFYAKNNGFKNYVSSATIAHLTGVKLKRLPIPLPPLSLQKHFGRICLSVRQFKTKLNESQIEMDHQFNSLVQRAFRGEL